MTADLDRRLAREQRQDLEVMPMMRTTLKTNNDMAMTVHKLEARLAQERAARLRAEQERAGLRSTVNRLQALVLLERAKLAKVEAAKPEVKVEPIDRR
jgi:hypothetical protein